MAEKGRGEPAALAGLGLDYPADPVTAEEVQTLFSPGWAIQSLGVTDILAREDKFRERGLTPGTWDRLRAGVEIER